MSDKTPWTHGRRTLDGKPLSDYAIMAGAYCIATVDNEEHARLIAAAPEMAELLSKISDAYEPVDYVPAVRDLLKRIGAP